MEGNKDWDFLFNAEIEYPMSKLANDFEDYGNFEGVNLRKTSASKVFFRVFIETSLGNL